MDQKPVISYYYKPLVLQIGKGFDGTMQYYAHMSFDFTARSYSREVLGSWIQELNVSSHVAASNILIFGCFKATVLVPATPGRNYVVISVSVHSR